jgi:hypothetical protein
MRIKLGNYEITLLEINQISMKVSMALAVEDKDGIRHKAGDIIAVKPAGWEWGTEEVKRFLIVEVDLPIRTMEEAERLQIPLYENGTLEPEGNETIIGKRRFQLPLEELEKTVTIDRTRLTDISQKYQPLEGVTVDSVGIVDKVETKTIDINTIKNG